MKPFVIPFTSKSVIIISRMLKVPGTNVRIKLSKVNVPLTEVRSLLRRCIMDDTCSAFYTIYCSSTTVASVESDKRGSRTIFALA